MSNGERIEADSVQGLIEARLTDIEERIKDMRHVRKVLKLALAQCHQQKNSECCHIVRELQHSSK